MTLYNGPRDVIAHIRQMEANLNPAGFDHSQPAKQGWRAERERAELAARRDADQKRNAAFPASPLARLTDWIAVHLAARKTV